MPSKLRIYPLKRESVPAGRIAPPRPLPSCIPPVLRRPASALARAVFLRGVTKHFFPQSRGRGAPRLLGFLKQDFS